MNPPADFPPTETPSIAADFLPYDRLPDQDRASVRRLATAYREHAAKGRPRSVEEELDAAPRHLRPALLEHLLQIEGEQFPGRSGFAPTLYEFEKRHPSIAAEIRVVYPRLPPECRAPDELGSYRVQWVIDRGSQSAVVFGEHRYSPKRMAIKYSADPEGRRRLHGEATFLTELKGLKVPRMEDAGPAPDDIFYVVIEYLEGRNLLTYVKDRGPDELIAAGLIAQVAETIDEVHRRHILHRDLSPRNIHVGDDGVVRVIDFGLAIDWTHGTGPRRDVPEFHGTTAVMAAEQLAGDGSVDGRLSDVAALGRLLYFAALGVEALLDSAPQAAGGSRQEGVPRKPALSPRLGRIYEAAVDPDPKRRYQSAGELARELRRFLRAATFKRIALHPATLVAGLAVAVIALFVARTATETPTPGAGNASGPATASPISPAMARILEHQNLVLAIATADAETLRQVRGHGVTAEKVVAALREKSAGETECAAARFFAAGGSADALTWLEDALDRGLDPDTLVPGNPYESETLLRSAIRNRNVDAALLLLDHGASPHAYQSLLGHYDDTPPFLFPYVELREQTWLTDGDRKRLAAAYRRGGAAVPQPVPTEQKPSHQYRELDAVAAQSRSLFGFPLERTPNLLLAPASPIAERVTRRSGFDWNRFLAEMPKMLHLEDGQGLAGGRLSVFAITQLLAVVDDKAYFLGSTLYAGKEPTLVEADRSGRNWSIYVYGGTSLWAVGRPYLKPGDTYEDAFDRRFWRRYDFVYDAETLTMSAGSNRYRAFRTAADAGPEE